jgi:hypothetical protein
LDKFEFISKRVDSEINLLANPGKTKYKYRVPLHINEGELF